MVRKVMFYSLLLPYLLLGTIGGIYIMVMYRTTVEDNRKAVIANNISIMRQIDKDMKYILEDADHLLSEINSIDLVMQLREMETERTGADNYRIGMALNTWKGIGRFNTYIDDILVYFERPDLYVTTRSIRTPKLLREEYQMESQVEEAQWEAFLTETYENKQLVMVGEELFLAVTNTYGEGEGTASLFIKFDTGKIRGMIDGYHSMNEGTFSVLNRDGTAMISNQPVAGKDASASGVPGEPDPKQDVVIRQQGEAMGIGYLWFTDKRVIDQKFDYILESFCLVGILFSLLLLAGIWSVRVNYRQINRILDRLKDKQSHGAGRKKCTEIGFIHAALNVMEEQLGAQDRVLLEDAVKKGIYGLLEDGDEAWRFLLNKAPFLFSGQTVIAVWGSRAKDETAVKERKLDIFILDNVLGELLGEQLWMGILPFPEWNVVLLNGTWEESQGIDWIMESMEHARQFLTDYLGNTYTIGVSSPMVGVRAWKRAYREAVTAYEEGKTACSESVVCYETVAGFGHTYLFSHHTRKRLLNCLKAGDGQEVQHILDEIYDRNFIQTRLSAESSRILILEVAGVCLEAAEGMEPGCPLRMAELMEEDHSAHTMFEEIQTAASFIAEHSGSIRPESAVYVTELITYIQQHYFDVELNVNGIAEQFSMNPSYLSRVFKEKTGNNLLDYINQYRTEAAKKLLCSTNDSVACIAEQVGFGNGAAIMRAFKKHEGITPGQYRNAYREQEKQG